MTGPGSDHEDVPPGPDDRGPEEPGVPEEAPRTPPTDFPDPRVAALADDRDISGPLLFREDGWSWAWILAAPGFCGMAGLASWAMGAPIHVFLLTVCAVATMFCHAIMIAATRVHGRVLLSETEFQQGTEKLALSDVEGVYPPSVSDDDRDPDRMEWEDARTLGELRSVPRRRGTVGLRLTGGGNVRVWARDPGTLRELLIDLVGEAEPRTRREADEALEAEYEAGLDVEDPVDEPGEDDRDR